MRVNLMDGAGHRYEWKNWKFPTSDTYWFAADYFETSCKDPKNWNHGKYGVNVQYSDGHVKWEHPNWSHPFISSFGDYHAYMDYAYDKK